MKPFKIAVSQAENDRHLDNIRTCSCVICGDDTGTEAAHLRMAAARYGKPNTGIGIKPLGPNGEECWVLALCGRHHRRQHAVGEFAFWDAHHWIDPFGVGMALWIHRHNQEAMEEICKENNKPPER